MYPVKTTEYNKAIKAYNPLNINERNQNQFIHISIMKEHNIWKKVQTIYYIEEGITTFIV